MTLFHNLVISTCLLVCVAVGLNPPEANPQPNPPSWPPSVRVFNPDDPIEQIQSAVDAAFEINGGDGDKGQFSTARFAFLFTPGTYPVDVPVGYYTHIMGLGLSPDDTVISGPKGVHCEEGTKRFDVGALNTFWRAAENFRSTSRFNWFGGETGMLWAVSQASPLRRVNVDGDLLLFQAAEQDNEITIDNSTALVYEDENGVLVAGYSSGGFLADSAVEGRVKSGSQQQWLSRNSQIQGGWEGSNWNIVFVGTTGAPPSHCGKDGGQPYVTVDETPLIAEKPFLSVDERGQYSLLVPPVVKGTKGVSFDLSGKGNRRKTQGKTKKEQPVQIDFSQVYVANNATDSAESINDHLRLGFHVVITPGVYSLEAPLTVVHENQVVLGIGLPSLIPSAGVSSVLQISRKAEGARVAGLLVEAGRGGDREDVLVDIGVDFEGVDEGRGQLVGEFLVCSTD
uniref:Pectate lyase superfamily protein domain-containing protein n=2 Tax=Chromera velia CCMP2878 TaxID=1169474 RepID=A0A0K6SAJ1_9ALVE|eukprot:Cvel_34512.t1-p1 / transcript=Cvel_34512.t1 / gene=Cvel_34512 / organism=Chromera_velia_CCMP2878 / gene_product=hypothetical protein / transcript_product=hypothetical protein / location=Cvel_scaffold5954:2174-3532(+) / protein_length=453 / sequence_SO=supercontig / SO=protein_coding / is_pseudo=false